MQTRIDEIAKTLAREDLSRRAAIRKIGSGLAGAVLAALGLGTMGNTSALAGISSDPRKSRRALKRVSRRLQLGVRDVDDVRRVADVCFGVGTATDLSGFWSTVGFGPINSADDVCTCWSRSVIGVGACTPDLAYDVCMILTGNAPLGDPPNLYAGSPNNNPIDGCFF